MEREPDSQPAADEFFAALRQEHSRILERLTQVEAAALHGGAPVDEAPLRELVRHLGVHFRSHAGAEDALLFPALDAAFPEARGLLAPLRADHAEARLILAELAAGLERRREPARDEQLLVLARDLVDLLRLHVQKEETVVFALARRVLGEADCRALGRKWESFAEQEPRDIPAPPGSGGPSRA